MWWWTLLGGCGGGDLAAGECRTGDDCGEGLVCERPDAPLGCGVPPAYGCDDCGADQYCAFDPSDCGSYTCHDACDGDVGCSDDEVCDPASRQCAPRSCEAGFRCAPDEVCDPSGGADAHGCAHPACDGDGDCGGGFCVAGACFAEPGQCTSDLPAP